ncbi:zinc finger protein BRUTUS-like At1g18910 [Ricinus communis]|uniref:Zinc finger protein, putative n=1 Tax=Ricinus communis TaxID=3988 RepID=B9R926_RICCO|nr:zinc finger protein BRUTUS-like At1g18910 [Ricinus communis]EEF52103.1 zinc finger protein, putative [Ricinus communis]|eukprot:XP_002511501.1 zinc finger protein BRUTUS-like At1g18910 [Ricinus communis]
MGGGDSPKCPPDKEEEALSSSSMPAVESEPLSHVSLTDAPILLLVYFHKAMREELSELYRLAVLASESLPNGRQLIVELRRRFDFFKHVQKYHSAFEDEVIFLELDAHIKNIVYTYSLEHNSIDDIFDSIFHCLSTLEENKDGAKTFQELLSCIGTMDSSICKHMLKEEEQVFPLLIQHFSPKEQALLVWQFFCSIPVILLVELLPWLTSFLTPEKRLNVTRCIEGVVPQEKSLQEVVVSWLHMNGQSSLGVFSKIRKEASDGPECLKSMPRFYFAENSLREKRQWKKSYCVQTNARNNVIDCLKLWHRAIQTDLKEILEEAYLTRNSRSFSDIDSTIVRLKFLADVIIFYSNALKKFFYPVLNELANKTCSSEQFSIESRVESIHQLLQSKAENGFPFCKFVEKLCQELEFLAMDVSKKFSFQETEVLPLISKKFSNDTQQQLLYMSLHLMPLGLLKCVIPWFAAHLSENEFSSFLHGINLGNNLTNSYFASLLLEWFCTGYSGKTSIENFGKNLQKLFKNRCSFIPEQIKEAVVCSSLLSNVQPLQESKPSKMEPVFSNKGKNLLSHSSSRSCKAEMYEASYASNINLHIFFPGTKRLLHPIPRLPAGESSATFITNEPKPMDFIFFFHKALKKDLEYLVSGSAQLAENIRFLVEFSQHFHLLWLRYQFHSETEDEIAFPALEAKGNVQNISYSYTIDHKLEVKLFNEISLILEKMSKLHVSLSTVDSGMLDQTVAKYNQQCKKLHLTCKSMHKLLSDHIHHEEIELWPLFRECFSIEEQEKIIGLMIGKVGAKFLQDMIPWLTGSLTPEEQHVLMSLWRKVTKNTKFDEWLGEWLEGYDIAHVSEESNTVRAADPLEIISSYLPKDALRKQGDKGIEFSQKDSSGANIDLFGKCNLEDKAKAANEDQNNEYSECAKSLNEGEKKRFNEVANELLKTDIPGEPFQPSPNTGHHEHLLTMSQDDLESAVRRVSRDSSLDPQKKSYIIQNLLMSRWIVKQRISHTKETISSNGEDIPGQYPSYRDRLKVNLGCKHYKRNCKLFTACCNKLYTCIRCHDEEADHTTDRKGITKMMCMKCLAIQPIGKACSSPSCNNLSMAKYYCSICKLFDDDREIYHCPYCNLCRVGKGLGIDYFHCMNCNACMSKSLLVHVCREKCLEGNCPICHEYIFTSSNPVKALPCGHLMHSTCFQEYTCTHYICPICSKSLGDMQVYFKMLDALLAEEKMPDEYSGKTQVILCNDCEKKGPAAFHWHYHKCPFCDSYNTRLL